VSGAPWSKYKNPEVVSEGGPWAKYGQTPYGATTMMDFGIGQAPVPNDPEELARLQEDSRVPFMSKKERFLAGMPAPELPEKMGKLSSGGIGYADSTTLGNYAETEGAAAAYPTYSKNGAGILAGFFDKAGILPDFAGGGKTEQADQFEEGYEQLQSKAMTDNPLSYLGGELGGYFVPGGAAWSGAGNTAKKLPMAKSIASQVGNMGRIPSYIGRMTTSGAGFTADAALHGATVGASREEAATGQKLDAGQRAGLAKDYALANVGDVAEGFGVEVPGFLKGIPIAPMLPVAGSMTERGLKGLTSGGKMVTPDRVQANVLQNTGRAPSPNSTAAAMAEVLPAERITGGSVKTFRFIENALRNGLKDSGLASTDITRRVTRGFNSIRESLPALADGRTTLAQLIEREFSDAGPQVSENLRLFLLRVGLDDPAVTRGVINDMRTGQVDDFRNAVDENFGAQNTYAAETEIKGGLDKIGEGFNSVLKKAREQGGNSPMANSLREELAGSEFKFILEGAAKKNGRAWKDADTFIQQDPWTAAHIMKSELLELSRATKQSGNFEKYARPAAYLREMLNELPGYSTMAKKYAMEADVLDTLGHTSKVGKHEVTKPGFGQQLRKDARRERDVLRRADDYAGMPARQQDAAKLSTGEILKDQLRAPRPGGTTLDGQDIVGLRLSELPNEGMVSTNPEIPGALPTVFGEAGERISQKVDDIINSRKFLADIDPKTGSNTVNKANAQMSGDSVVTTGLPRTMTSGYTQSGLIDATMFASGLPPVATMLTKGIPALGKVFGPGKGTRAEIARALMQRPARQGAPHAAPAPIKPLTGRNRPRKWRNDPKWSDPNLTNPQIAGGPAPVQNGLIPGGMAGEMGTGAVVGGNIPVDYDGDGEVTFKDRAIGAGIGAAGSQAPRAVSRARSRVAGSGNLPRGASRTLKDGDTRYHVPLDDGGNAFVYIDDAGRGEKTVTMGATAKGVKYRNDTDRKAIGSVAQAKEVFDKTFRSLQDHIERHRSQVYQFSGSTESQRRMYANQLRRVGVPDGYVGLNFDNKNFFILKKGGARHREMEKFYANDARAEWITRTAPTNGALLRNHAESPAMSNGFGGGGGRRNMMNGIRARVAREEAEAAEAAARAQPPQPKPAPPGGPVVSREPPPLHSNEYTPRDDLIKAGVVGTGVGVPSAAVLYNWYVAEQYEKNKPAMSMQEFMRALETAQRGQNGLPPTPTLKPDTLPQQGG